MHAYFNIRQHKHEESLVRDYSDEIAETRSFVGHIESRTAEHFWIPQYLGFRETMPDFAGGDGKHSRVRK